MIKQDTRIGQHPTKGMKIRKVRSDAITHKSKVDSYSKISDWYEEDIGTDDEKYTVELKNGWSFNETERIEVATFSSVREAMIAVKNAYQFAR